MTSKIALTYKSVLLGNQFWSQLQHAAAPSDHVFYKLGKLHQKVDRLHKQVLNPAFKVWAKSMQEQYGPKGPNGQPLPIPGGNLPVPADEHREAYEAEFDRFMDQTAEIEFEKLPLAEYFGHLKKTPTDLEVLECIADFSEEAIKGPSKKPVLSSIN